MVYLVMEYDREALVQTLIYHQPVGSNSCHCGWAELGRSWAEHVANIYEIEHIVNIHEMVLKEKVPTVPSPILKYFDKYGPYFDASGGYEAFKYSCLDCDFKMITVATTDLLDENLKFLEQHQNVHHNRR